MSSYLSFLMLPSPALSMDGPLPANNEWSSFSALELSLNDSGYSSTYSKDDDNYYSHVFAETRTQKQALGLRSFKQRSYAAARSIRLSTSGSNPDQQQRKESYTTLRQVTEQKTHAPVCSPPGFTAADPGRYKFPSTPSLIQLPEELQKRSAAIAVQAHHAPVRSPPGFNPSNSSRYQIPSCAVCSSSPIAAPEQTGSVTHRPTLRWNIPLAGPRQSRSHTSLRRRAPTPGLPDAERINRKGVNIPRSMPINIPKRRHPSTCGFRRCVIPCLASAPSLALADVPDSFAEEKDSAYHEYGWEWAFVRTPAPRQPTNGEGRAAAKRASVRPPLPMPLELPLRSVKQQQEDEVVKCRETLIAEAERFDFTAWEELRWA